MKKQKLILLGGGGKTGNGLIEEALNRKYHVTAVTFDVNKVLFKHPDLEVVYGHIVNEDDIAAWVKEHDAVIAIHEPSVINPNEHIKTMRSVIEGTKKAEVKKMLAIGHPIHRPMENSIEFYNLWKPITWAQREVLKLLHHEMYLNWGYVYSDTLETDPATDKLGEQESMILATPIGENPIPIKNYARVLIDNALALTSRLELEINI
jgi:putative NADH-flavin reductase